jgi:15-cis-phytoene desaturase
MLSKAGAAKMATKKRKAVIAGSGLAGMSCARRLISAGWEIELVEAEPQFGGRTANWIDPDGQAVESGVHTFFGVYSHLMDLLDSVGVDVDDIVSWDDKVGILQPGNELNIFGIDPVRDLPRVLGGVVGNNRLIGPLDKLGLGVTFANGLLRRDEYERHTVARLARDGIVNSETYERIFRPLARGLAFCEPEELSAYVILTLISHAFTHPLGLRAGTFKGGMTDLMIKPIADYLEEYGATLRTNAPVREIKYENGKISGFALQGGETVTGDVYISALPLEVLQKLMPQELLSQPYFRNVASLPTVPALSVQLWFDRQFTDRNEFIFLAGSPFIVIQDESRETFPHHGTRISGQVTSRAADPLSDEELVNLALNELHTYMPDSLTATVEKAVVVRHAAIGIMPGVHPRRPRQGTPVSNFFLAGDYTRQNWFTTMEGATRSGEMAARAVNERWGRPFAPADRRNKQVVIQGNGISPRSRVRVRS